VCCQGAKFFVTCGSRSCTLSAAELIAEEDFLASQEEVLRNGTYRNKAGTGG